MNLQNIVYVLAIIYMVSYLLVLVIGVAFLIVISRKVKRMRREMDIRKSALQDWVKFAPLASILLFPVRKFVKKLIS